MQEAEDKQFTLKEDGRIYYQVMASNPLPGEPVGTIRKGEGILHPAAEMDSGHEEARPRVERWLQDHIARVLEPLAALGNREGLKPPAQDIAARIYDSLGIVPREELDSVIAGLDQDDRRDLRARKIRLGPILVFIPALNKPAAVRLRALLWSLYHDKPLPAAVPADGIVSCEVDSAAVDPAFYQAIGYPVFGGRAVRIDMLDRVINAVYDSASGGKFEARHDMAEWLGCPIEGLYAVLSAMGHTKIEEPDAVAAQPAASAPDDSVSAPAETETETVAEAAPSVQPQIKPKLATFRLKKGKAFEKPGAGKAPRKPSQADSPKHKAPEKKGGGKRNKSTNRTPRIMQAGPERRLEDSPFAVLQQLKVKGDDKG
ncbi:MAG: hypothetical protein KDJ75_04635 [Alphaproteobacteria bacterium]|nr:hypothetical protein [Alphaproteobacteria bacterium]